VAVDQTSSTSGFGVAISELYLSSLRLLAVEISDRILVLPITSGSDLLAIRVFGLLHVHQHIRLITPIPIYLDFFSTEAIHHCATLYSSFDPLKPCSFLGQLHLGCLFQIPKGSVAL
jgi:hypothetical protein